MLLIEVGHMTWSSHVQPDLNHVTYSHDLLSASQLLSGTLRMLTFDLLIYPMNIQSQPVSHLYLQEWSFVRLEE